MPLGSFNTNPIICFLLLPWRKIKAVEPNMRVLDKAAE
jgi:hypothetical protein